MNGSQRHQRRHRQQLDEWSRAVILANREVLQRHPVSLERMRAESVNAALAEVRSIMKLNPA